MLADNDPLKGFIDTIPEDQLIYLKNLFLLFGLSPEETKLRLVEKGYCSQETADKLFSD